MILVLLTTTESRAIPNNQCTSHAKLRYCDNLSVKDERCSAVDGGNTTEYEIGVENLLVNCVRGIRMTLIWILTLVRLTRTEECVLKL